MEESKVIELIHKYIRLHEVRVACISGVIGFMLLLINFIWLFYLTFK